MSNLNIKQVETNQPFFGKYRYSVKFSLQDLGVIRGLDPDSIDGIVEDRNRWRQASQHSYASYYRSQIISDETKQHLKVLCNLLLPHKDHIKFVISYDRGFVYTNDIRLVKTIDELDIVSNKRIQEACQICPTGTIALYDPKWTHRTYFKSRHIDAGQRKTLSDYLVSRENVRLSPGLKSWLKENHSLWWSHYTHAHFFLDHNNDGELLFLNMVVPNITGRTLDIVAK